MFCPYIYSMKIIGEALRSRKAAVFFDFDNTIADRDVFDDMLIHFGSDPYWRELEKKWLNAKIGSRICLDGQIRCMSLDKKALDSYLARVKLDPYFNKLLRLLRAHGVRPAILSDNFDYILRRVLKSHAIKGLKVYSNKARLRGGKLIPSFPFTDKDCPSCAHCKKKNLLSVAAKDSIIIYVGDGRTDRCPAKYAHVVFAKGYLLNYCKKEKLPFVPFKTLKDVYACFKKSR